MEKHETALINWSDFEKVELLAGTIINVEPFEIVKLALIGGIVNRLLP